MPSTLDSFGAGLFDWDEFPLVRLCQMGGAVGIKILRDSKDGDKRISDAELNEARVQVCVWVCVCLCVRVC